MAATQRKKTDKTTTTAAAAVAGNDEELTDQLNRAQEAVERNHAATQTLHAQWRTQLLRMAYLVMIVTLHIAQAPSSTCIKDIKVSVLDMNRHCHSPRSISSLLYLSIIGWTSFVVVDPIAIQQGES